MSLGIAKKSRRLQYMYRAKVEDNVDPDGLGRIRARIYPMFSDSQAIPTQYLPWSVPAMGLFVGAGEGFGSFSVPEVGTMVFVFFEAGDPYQPVYFASATDGLKGIPSASATDYPYTKVFRTQNGIQIKLNDKVDSEDILVTHPKGSTIQMDKDGKIEIKTALANGEDDDKGDINVEATQANINMTADKGKITIEATDATINVIAKGQVTIDAPHVLATGTIAAKAMPSGTFQAADKMITVANGLIEAMS